MIHLCVFKAKQNSGIPGDKYLVFLKVEVLVKMKVYIFLHYGLFNIFKVMFMENMHAW